MNRSFKSVDLPVWRAPKKEHPFIQFLHTIEFLPYTISQGCILFPRTPIVFSVSCCLFYPFEVRLHRLYFLVFVHTFLIKCLLYHYFGKKFIIFLFNHSDIFDSISGTRQSLKTKRRSLSMQIQKRKTKIQNSKTKQTLFI